jgi:ubiquitin carboxyl-terminal hydrolase L3
MPKNWFPLESNPYVMGNYIQSLGVDMTLLKFHDVLSTEEWALEMIPKPVLGWYLKKVINLLRKIVCQGC